MALTVIATDEPVIVVHVCVVHKLPCLLRLAPEILALVRPGQLCEQRLVAGNLTGRRGVAMSSRVLADRFFAIQGVRKRNGRGLKLQPQ